MTNFLIQYSKTIVLLALACLLAMNITIIANGLNSNVLGIGFSIVLFLIGGRKTSFNMNYPLLGLIFLLEFISYRLHTKSLHFLALSFLVCLVFYHFTQKFSFIAFICIMLFSSIFNTFFDYLTVEIKQTLCYTVYLTLKNFISIDKIEGVNFYIKNAKITIDTACMGLSMFKTGLLFGAFLLTLEEQKKQKYYNIKQIFLFCFLVILLNIVSNYFRIITLVLFNCTQENTLHYTIGILCFMVYQIVPMLLIIRFFIPKKETIANSKIKSLRLLPLAIGGLILFATSLEIKQELDYKLLDGLNSSYTINKGIWVNKEVFKIVTPQKLTYIKTIAHNPLICWTGNGYKVIESKVITKNKEKIHFVRMEKNNVQYVSYWWYEMENQKYTSLPQALLTKLICNKSIRLVNETCVAP